MIKLFVDSNEMHIYKLHGIVFQHFKLLTTWLSSQRVIYISEV